MTLLTRPYLFDEFFASGKEDSISPFLTPDSKKWGKNLALKTAFTSAFFLAAAFVTSFFLPPLSNLCLLMVYFLSGTPALLGAVHDLRYFNINIDVLMTLAALLSVIIGSGIEGALLLVLFELSAAMEVMVMQKTKNTLTHLNKITPRTAYVVGEEGHLIERSVREIPANTHLLIKAGEIVPLDGTVVGGSSFVNLVHLTGESYPIPKTTGDTVPAGARNLDGTLTIQVTRTSSDSTLSRIIQLITEAQEAKPRLQKLLDRFGRRYAMTIISLCFLFSVLLPSILSIPFLGPEGSVYRALAFLIAASPCALIIATPTAYLSAISWCARRGILLKGGAILDTLTRCTKIAFDKTGTLTTGQLQLALIEPVYAPNCSIEEALSVAYALERNAKHPIAEAINTAAQQRSLRPQSLTQFKSIPGFGLEGTLERQGEVQSCFIGHADYMTPLLPETALSAWNKSPLPKEGHLQTLLLIKDNLFAFRFTDALREEIGSLVHILKEKHHLETVMLTGDRLEIATPVAREIGIDEVHAELRPEDKLKKVAEFAASQGLIMVGDGINDAPALARATVGIAMGKVGSATAIEAADVVILNDDLFLLSGLLNHSHKTVRIVRQNISLALVVILFATTPALLGLVPLWTAVLLHEGGTVLVGLNSLRLLK